MVSTFITTDHDPSKSLNRSKRSLIVHNVVFQGFNVNFENINSINYRIRNRTRYPYSFSAHLQTNNKPNGKIFVV